MEKTAHKDYNEERKCGGTNQSYRLTTLTAFTGWSPSMRFDWHSLWTSRRFLTPSTTFTSHKISPISISRNQPALRRHQLTSPLIKVLAHLSMYGKRLMPPHLCSCTELYYKLIQLQTIFTIYSGFYGRITQ